MELLSPVLLGPAEGQNALHFVVYNHVALVHSHARLGQDLIRLGCHGALHADLSAAVGLVAGSALIGTDALFLAVKDGLDGIVDAAQVRGLDLDHVAGLVIGVGTPMVAYVTVNGQTVLSGSRMTIIAGVFSVCAILCYLLCFHLVRERVDVPANNSKMDIGKMLKSVFTNRALLGIIAAALFLLLAMLTMQGMAGYVFPNFYGSAAAQSTASLLSSVLILLVCAPFASKLASRFGKKELATVSCIVATVLEVICFVLKPANVWVYVGFYCAAFICLGFFNTIIWAMITDVIDDSEVRNGIREDGTIYAVYSFARKLGQAFSSGLTGGLLTMIGYSAATAFDPEVTMGIFNISCIAPAIGFVAVALSLFFIYPLTKQKVEENVAALAQRHNK